MQKNVLADNEVITVINGDNSVSFDGTVCMQCVPFCPGEALYDSNWSISIPGYFPIPGVDLGISTQSCIIGEGCNGDCQQVCPVDAITVKLNDNETPEIPPKGLCELYPDICELSTEGRNLSDWAKNQCDVIMPKGNNALQTEAAKWGMTVEIYISDKLGLIAASGNYVELGKVAKTAGYVGLAYGTYSAAVAVSDGKLTANELIGIVSTGLGFIALIPGVGTAVGLGGLAVISAGSLVLVLVANSDLGKDEVLLDWAETSICN